MQLGSVLQTLAALVPGHPKGLDRIWNAGPFTTINLISPLRPTIPVFCERPLSLKWCAVRRIRKDLNDCKGVCHEMIHALQICLFDVVVTLAVGNSQGAAGATGANIGDNHKEEGSGA
jgi:hypothetical protein